jgi:hypothetical protein
LANEKTLEQCRVRNNDILRAELAAEQRLQDTAKALQQFYQSQPHIMEQLLAVSNSKHLKFSE